MNINLDQIQEVLKSADLDKLEEFTGVKRSTLENYRYNTSGNFDKMKKLFIKLQEYYEEEKKMIKLIEASEDGRKVEGVFENEKDLIAHLQTNDYFSWINDNEPDKELPDFSKVETLREVEAIFDEYDYNYWRLEIEKDTAIKRYEVFFDSYKNQSLDTRLDGEFFDNIKDATEEYNSLVAQAKDENEQSGSRKLGVSLMEYSEEFEEYDTIKFYDPYEN